jgi:streptogramin lyase
VNTSKPVVLARRVSLLCAWNEGSVVAPSSLRAAIVLAAAFAASLIAMQHARCYAGEPVIIEYGPTFRTEVTGIAIGADGTVWVGEDDGIARLSSPGAVVQVRRADDCYSCYGAEIGIAAGTAWQNGSDRALRFDGNGLHDYDARHSNCGSRAFGATATAVFTSSPSERGLHRIDPNGNDTLLLRDAGWIQQAAAARDGSLWLGISKTEWCASSPAVSLARYAKDGSLQYVSVPGLSKYTGLAAFTVAPDGSLLFIAAPAGPSHQDPGSAFVVRVLLDGTLSEVAKVTQMGAYYGVVGGIAAAPDGTIWYTEPSANRIAHIGADGKTTEFRDGIPAGARPGAIAAGHDGSVWFTDNALNTVEHLTLDGRVRVYGNGITPWNTPGAPVVSDDGALWFPETLTWHPRVARIARDGTVSEFPAFLPSLPDGSGVIAIDYSSSTAGTRAVRYSATGAVGPFDATGCIVTQMNLACFASRGRFKLALRGATPDWVARGPDGNLWFTDVANSQIGRVTPSGALTLFTRGLTKWNSGPQYITTGPDGALWFTEVRSRVGRITPDGHIREFSRGIPARSSIGGIVAGRDGNLWFTLYHGNELARITPAGVVTRFRRGIYPSRGNDSSTPDSVPFVDRNGTIWFNEPQGGRIAAARIF